MHLYFIDELPVSQVGIIDSWEGTLLTIPVHRGSNRHHLAMLRYN